MNCAPGNKNKSLLSCYSREQLRKMVKAIRKDNNQSNENLIKTLRKEFPDCIDETCFLEQEPIKNVLDKEMKDYTFKPKMPDAWLKDKNTWLSTTDIEKVMKQYEREYSDFKYFGPFPIDCPVEINCEVTNLNLNSLLKKGKKRIGIGYNLDKHYQPGSHWVSLYIDIPKSTIIYYDSTASEAPYILRQFIEMLLKQLDVMNKKARFDYNKKQHQYGGSECGVYSMNFIVEMLKGKTLEDFQKKKISDSSVNLLRDYFYRTSSKKIKY